MFRKHSSQMLNQTLKQETLRLDTNISRHYSPPNKEHCAVFSFKEFMFYLQLCYGTNYELFDNKQ
jgi:hypothetical protein